MSCFIDIDGDDVWNPSNQVAALFIGESRAVAQAFGVDSGVGDNIEDQCSIDSAAFASCVSVALEGFAQSNNAPLRALLEGWLAVALELLRRAGVDQKPGVAQIPDALRERVNAVSQRMTKP